MKTTTQRRNDIDWLRTLAFFILIGYHIGMYYVLDWGWHIKSPHQFQGLQDVMILTNQWRMSLLFFISAMAFALYEQRYGNKNILKIRSKRLLTPLLLGMLIIVPPQQYIELQHTHGLTAGYWDYLLTYYGFSTDIPADIAKDISLTWNHLWFLPYLFCYTLILLVIGRGLRWCAQLDAKAIPAFAFTLLLVLVMSVIWLSMRRHFPTTHDLLNDWYSHGKYFWVFVVGYLLAYMPKLWDRVIQQRWWFLAFAVAGYSFLIADRHDAFPTLASQFEDSLWVQSIYSFIVTLNHWCWILAVVGLAGAYLRFSNVFLRYASQAVLPWYIMHQTLIVVAAALLQPFNLPVMLDFILILSITIGGCYISYELAKRTALTRTLFGLK
ncbi:acyltransferase family protein [Alteromonas facilis]|uniref:acyltransferase family protein n=1 Tax=Alteromonas facilis TaxID=2048004 RepID=UPI000C28863D|nr:acyltransferase family protein [Alteromonas facilis]